ncbi:MAG: DUF5329 family protein [Methylococcales bacterium]|nr:DUF5329 family protein [Methylococcales bacterium]MCK5924337.1 DUF5329 family protein [Methylococcales bacterium]
MKYISIAVFMLFSSFVHAELASEQEKEIQHLFAFIKDSSCEMNRNGTLHKSADAAEHIQKKYEYFKKKIHNTADFIQLSATKSTVSGRFYTVTCGDNPPLKAKEWLLGELKKFRTTQ